MAVTYSQKVVQNLKPQWYLDLSSKEKLKLQADLKTTHNTFWQEKPKNVSLGQIVICDTPSSTLTKGKNYKVLGYHCTLVSTIYYSKWNEFITIKNDYGFTVKVNLNNFSH